MGFVEFDKPVFKLGEDEQTDIMVYRMFYIAVKDSIIIGVAAGRTIL